MSALIHFGDCREGLRQFAAAGLRAQTCVTSPPYFGLRDYGREGQLGLEQTPEEYIAAMVEVFRRVRDVLADDGTLWVNIGDSYANGGRKTRDTDDKLEQRGMSTRPTDPVGVKPKDLIGIPWMLAFALRADGWYLRQDIIWHKPNPMPESVKDRCTKSHEYVFLFAKSERYYFDADCVKEPSVDPGRKRGDAIGHTQRSLSGRQIDRKAKSSDTRNRRSVWSVNVCSYKGAHFATFPPALIEPCILAGSKPGDFVLDPFMGSGTTAEVAIRHGRMAMGCELNPEYKKLIDERLVFLK